MPILLFWMIVIYTINKKMHYMLYVFFCSLSFGSFAIIPTALTGGLTITAAPMVAILIFIRNMTVKRNIDSFFRMAVNPRQMLLLTLFWILAVFLTLFMPRFFNGDVYIIPMRLTKFTSGEALSPTTQNISQLAYLTISIISVPSFAILLRPPEMRQHAMIAMVYGAITAVFTGILDFSSQYVPLDFILEPFRTATYALLTDNTVMDVKRVVGLMPEASSYGSLTMMYLVGLYFFRHAIEDKFIRNFVVPYLLIAILVMVWLSTSSAAYVGLAILGVLVALDWFWRAGFLSPRDRRRKGLGGELWIAIVAVMVPCVIFILDPTVLDPIIGMIDNIIFQKSASSSFEERGMWTAVSWQALLDTRGLGVGIGSTRTSNGIVAVVSATGFLGAFLYYSFIALSLSQRAKPGDATGAAMISAVRWAFMPSFIINALIGTSADFGANGALRYGLTFAIAASLPAARRSLKPRAKRPPVHGVGPHSARGMLPPSPRFTTSPAAPDQSSSVSQQN